jgi:hypothetical protein
MQPFVQIYTQGRSLLWRWEVHIKWKRGTIHFNHHFLTFSLYLSPLSSLLVHHGTLKSTSWSDTTLAMIHHAQACHSFACTTYAFHFNQWCTPLALSHPAPYVKYHHHTSTKHAALIDQENDAKRTMPSPCHWCRPHHATTCPPPSLKPI